MKILLLQYTRVLRLRPLSKANSGLFGAAISRAGGPGHQVNGVGVRTALGALSGTSPEEFAVWIETKDLTRLAHLPGIGKKTAERLIVELRDRIIDWRPGVLPGGAAPAGDAFGDAKMDAISGLVALGYKPLEASRHVQSLDTEGLSSEAIIRAVLRGQLQG